MFKLVLEKAEEPQIKLPTPVGSLKEWEFQKNMYFCLIDYAKAFDCVDHNKLWKILKEMGIPDHLTCLLRNLYAGQEATVRTGHGTTDCFQIGKGVHQGCILLPCLCNIYRVHHEKCWAGWSTRWNQDCLEKYNNLRYADDTTLMVEFKELKSLWWKWKEESEKVGVKLHIQKTKIMASDPITSHQIDGERVETLRLYFWGGSKITADHICKINFADHSKITAAIKLRCLLLWRKVMTNLDSILKSRDMTLPSNACLVKSTVSPVVMYGCKSWIIKKAEHWKIDTFELWCWRRFLSPLGCRRSNQSILKEIHPEYLSEGLMVKLKLQYFHHLMQKADYLKRP